MLLGRASPMSVVYGHCFRTRLAGLSHPCVSQAEKISGSQSSIAVLCPCSSGILQSLYQPCCYSLVRLHKAQRYLAEDSHPNFNRCQDQEASCQEPHQELQRVDREENSWEHTMQQENVRKKRQTCTQVHVRAETPAWIRMRIVIKRLLLP